MEKLKRLLEVLREVVVGKDEVLEQAVVALVAGGHLLLEDLPGTGKTTLALALARACGCEFKKLSFTSDTLPADVVGAEVYRRETGDFEVRLGPIFTNVLLVDEINRASPRTQSALLEAMAEGKVSIGGKTFELPKPFWVIATQNPLELHGTYPLPESQLDRFFMRLSLGYPGRDHEKKILAEENPYEKATKLKPVLSKEDLLEIQKLVEGVKVSQKFLDYVVELGERSRSDRRFSYGLSTRALIHLKKAATARAFLKGRDFVTPDDLKAVFVPVTYHRLVPSLQPLKEFERIKLLEEFLEEVPVPL